jgi:hypothetical protein
VVENKQTKIHRKIVTVATMKTQGLNAFQNETINTHDITIKSDKKFLTELHQHEKQSKYRYIKAT